MSLTSSSTRLLTVPNAGGSSIISEVLSFEMLARCFGAQLVKTEMEVEYFPQGGSITDYVARIYDNIVGVSVTRAMKYNGKFNLEDANRLLYKKLNGVLQSSKNNLVGWVRQILHVWAKDDSSARMIRQAYNQLDDHTIRSNTIVLITVTNNIPILFGNLNRRSA